MHEIFQLAGTFQCAICPTPFPINVDRSIAPSPVMTRSAARKRRRRFALRANEFKSRPQSRPQKQRTAQSPSPPAAHPALRCSDAEIPLCVLLCNELRQPAQIEFRPWQSPLGSVPSAIRKFACNLARPATCFARPRPPPFPRTNAFVRVAASLASDACRRVHDVIGFPARSKNSQPSARATPNPPSFVALPPMPIKQRRAPLAAAARTTAPNPNVSSLNG